MKKIKIGDNQLLKITLVVGIIYLASTGKDGWGWLVFVLLCLL